jgi:transposase-like protein
LKARIETDSCPLEVVTDRAPAYVRVVRELTPGAEHTVRRWANNPIESDHARLKARLRPMLGLKNAESAAVVVAGHAFLQNVRRGHYLVAAASFGSREESAFRELTRAA